MSFHQLISCSDKHHRLVSRSRPRGCRLSIGCAATCRETDVFARCGRFPPAQSLTSRRVLLTSSGRSSSSSGSGGSSSSAPADGGDAHRRHGLSSAHTSVCFIHPAVRFNRAVVSPTSPSLPHTDRW
ncbi:hypothetical protein Q5P01_007951 [Channa striata]|uniref:Uncharacterized protein n=1 Tax=Channa striata TaxID=64152 RepID=A0AA88N516_CHASR|nr:hypothetical protein Q5P01_007951 [Channa striata]